MTGHSLFSGMILVDELPRPLNFFEGFPDGLSRPQVAKWRPVSSVLPKNKLRLMPPQEMRNHFIIDYIANRSIRFKTDPQTREKLWAWSFDPQKDKRMNPMDRFPASFIKYLTVDFVKSMTSRIAFLVGDESIVSAPDVCSFAQSSLGDRAPVVVIRNSGHHIMVSYISLVMVFFAALPIARLVVY